MSESVKLFGEAEVKSAYRTKKMMLVVYFACLGLVLAVIIVLAVVNLVQVNTSYDRSNKALFTFISSLLGSVYTLFSMFFFSIKYRLTKKYVKMLKGFEKGILDTTEVTFLSFDSSVVFKDGVNFYTMIVNSKPLRRDDITERRILIEHTIEKPEFNEGDKIKVTTHGNILVEYKRL